uniref:Tetratricopeptide repeat protein 14 n=1 Tax=Oryzias sinensis TaxID=183150 RepID=A0A8C7WUP5_9TELE
KIGIGSLEPCSVKPALVSDLTNIALHQAPKGHCLNAVNDLIISGCCIEIHLNSCFVCRYANKGSILKAISDFELALENCPDHRNARKYLCQTLVERGKQLEEQDKLVTAEGIYRRALSLDDSNPEAKEALHNISDLIQKSIRLREEALAKEQVKPKSSQTSAEKLRKILKEEKRMKKKKKRATSSSPSSSSSRCSSSRSSSSRKRSKKKKKRRRKSDRGSKRHRRISSRESRKSEEDRKEKEDEEAECYPEPPNTSATFLNQTGGLVFGGEDEVAGRDREARRGGLLNSVSAASEEDDSDSSRRETKRRDGAERRTRTAEQSRSPQGRGRSRERKLSIERGRDDYRKDSESQRRSSFEENQTRKSSCSSSEVEHSRKSSFLPEYSGNSCSASKQLERRMSHDSSSRNSFDGGRYENRGKKEEEPVKRGKEAGKEGSEVEGHTSGCGKVNAGSQNGQSGTGPKKELPANLLEIFNQIAQFEKKKGSQAKVPK